jgi:small GTP-binding protein
MANSDQPTLIYYDLSEKDAPNAIFWHPNNITDDLLQYIGLQSYSIISGDQDFLPQILLIFPLPTIRKKVLVKFFEERLTPNQYTSSIFSLNLLFNETDDLLFYRYMSYIDSYFSNTVEKIFEKKSRKANPIEIEKELMNLHDQLIDMMNYLRLKSEYIPPDEEKERIPFQIDLPSQQFKKFKVIFLGDPNVGKTSTILRFTDNVFMRAYIPTMGLNITKKRFRINQSDVELVLWDIGGQSRFELVRKQFYEGASAFILLFDLSRPTTFININRWNQDIQNYFTSKSNLLGYLVGNKSDLSNERMVKEIDALNMARALDLHYLEGSALTGRNIEQLFNNIAEALILQNSIDS